MKILLVSGFLGAGKTTFIKAMAKCTGKEFAILENEYGAAGVDGEILKSDAAAGNLNIWELAEGCICCSVKGDFAAAVLTIANTVDPDYLVIEPTGVAMLSRLLSELQKIEYERITLLAPVTVVDGHSFDRYIVEYPKLYKNQIASAHTVILSRTEQASAAEKDRLKAKIQAVNPEAAVITEHYSTFDKRQWLSLFERGFHGERLKTEPERTAELPDTFSVKEASVVSPEHLLFLMECLIRGEFGNIFRAKGQVRAGLQTFRFDVADRLYCITGGEANAGNNVVFIGTQMIRPALRRNFGGALPKIIPKKDKG